MPAHCTIPSTLKPNRHPLISGACTARLVHACLDRLREWSPEDHFSPHFSIKQWHTISSFAHSNLHRTSPHRLISQKTSTADTARTLRVAHFSSSSLETQRIILASSQRTISSIADSNTHALTCASPHFWQPQLAVPFKFAWHLESRQTTLALSLDSTLYRFSCLVCYLWALLSASHHQ